MCELISGNSIVFTGPGKPMEMRSGKIADLNAGEILVKNLFTTICGSDLHTYSGLRDEPLPLVLGHEIVGQIVGIGPDHPAVDFRGENISAGDTVTWSIFSSDPNSAHALEGIPQKGGKLFKYGHAVAEGDDVFHGGLAEYCILKAGTGILKIPHQLPLPVAATINCSISTVAGAMRLAGSVKNKKVFIFGMGMLGITCAAMCREAGAKWIGAADISAKRLELSRQYGVDEVFDASQHAELPVNIKNTWSTNGVDIAFDMSGSPDAMESSVSMLKVGGKAIWVGAVFKTRKVELNPETIIRNLLTIKGLHNYNFDDFVHGLDFMTKNWNRYPFERVVEKEFNLADAQLAFEYALQHKPLRVGIRIH